MTMIIPADKEVSWRAPLPWLTRVLRQAVAHADRKQVDNRKTDNKQNQVTTEARPMRSGKRREQQRQEIRQHWHRMILWDQRSNRDQDEGGREGGGEGLSCSLH